MPGWISALAYGSGGLASSTSSAIGGGLASIVAWLSSVEDYSVHHMIVSTSLLILILLLCIGTCIFAEFLGQSSSDAIASTKGSGSGGSGGSGGGGGGGGRGDVNGTDVEHGRAALLGSDALRSDSGEAASHAGLADGLLAPLTTFFRGISLPLSSDLASGMSAGTGSGAGGFAPAAVERSGRGEPKSGASKSGAGRGKPAPLGASPSVVAPPDGTTMDSAGSDGELSPSQLAAAEAAAAGGDSAVTVPPDFKMRRTKSAKLKADELSAILSMQKQERANAKRLAEEEAARAKRLRAYEATVSLLWESQWGYVQLSRLPTDVEKADEEGRRGVSEREPQLSGKLAGLLHHYFAALFDTYLFYAKVEADAPASELYKMTDFNWKTLLRDATVVGDSKDPEAPQLTTQAATAIFKAVNQRRDNLTQNKGKEAQAVNKGLKAADGTPTAYSEAALKATTGGEGASGTPRASGGGFSAGVTKAHYAAGSLYAFTFSEFLEGLLHVALELPPNSSGMIDRGEGGLTTEYILQQVHWLINDKILPNVRHGEVLEFRRMVVGSGLISSALDAINPMLDPLYERYAQLPSKGRYHGGYGCSLKAFLDLCQDADLVGQQLSHLNVKTAFVNSLSLGDDARKPLLDRAEFTEAVVRMAYLYKADTDDAEGGRAARKAVEQAAKPAKGREDAAVKLTESVKKKMPVTDSPRTTPPAGDWNASDANQRGDDEAKILESLPVVCGKLLSVLEAKAMRPSAGGNGFMSLDA